VDIAAVLCDGGVTGCSNNDPFMVQGNLAQDNLSEIWERRFGPSATGSG